ncbi:hypothetical protein ABZ612_11295 [Streptomyces avermitilis]|uniref:hypothetical protein n=1 Tax=Streptomyces avermitilis TaxID=33903 RepID=UPI0033D4D134
MARVPNCLRSRAATSFWCVPPVSTRNAPTASLPVAFATYEALATKKLSFGAVGNSGAPTAGQDGGRRPGQGRRQGTRHPGEDTTAVGEREEREPPHQQGGTGPQQRRAEERPVRPGDARHALRGQHQGVLVAGRGAEHQPRADQQGGRA